MRTPQLYLFIGLPGAGKTTIAKLIHDRTAAIHIWVDHERQRLFSEPTHSQAESLALYDRLNQEVDELLEKGESVIFDTNFNFYADRQKLRAIAARRGAEVRIIWVNTPKEVSKQRAIGQEAAGRNGYHTMMTAEQFEAIAAKLEPPTEDENIIKIDGTKLDETELLRQLSL